MSLRKVRPRRRHLRVRLPAHAKVVRLLVVLDPLGFEERSSLHRVVSEFALGCCFEISMVAAELVVRVYLIQGILVPEELVLGEAQVVALRIKLISLLGSEVLAVTARVIPVVVLEHILHLLVDCVAFTVSVIVVDELLQIAAIVTALQLPHPKIGLPHLLLLRLNIK